MGGTGYKSRAVALAGLALSFSALVKAHEHHTDKIGEGHFVSDDPIVRGVQ